MFRRVTTFLLLLSASLWLTPTSHAQWTDNGTSVTTSDDVGIGTSSPRGLLNAVDGPSGLLFKDQNGHATFWLDGSDGDFSGSDYTEFRDDGTGFQIRSHGNLGLRISSDGKVGIGTRFPTRKLDVSGSVGVSGALYMHSSDGDRDLWLVQNNGVVQFGAVDNGIVWQNSVMAVNLNSESVGIGTNSPREKLDVNGTTRTKEVIVTQQNWPDYVFAPDYDLPSLTQVRTFIDQNGHLPGIPDAETVHREGQRVGQTQAALLKKIEELTLYAMQQEEKADAQSDRVESLEADNARLRDRLDAQQEQIDWLMQQVQPND